jgi:hypothetical protein
MNRTSYTVYQVVINMIVSLAIRKMNMLMYERCVPGKWIFLMCKDYYSNIIFTTIFMQALVLNCRLENIFSS